MHGAVPPLSHMSCHEDFKDTDLTSISTVELISPLSDQEENQLMFLSEWREFSSPPCLAGKET